MRHYYKLGIVITLILVTLGLMVFDQTSIAREPTASTAQAQAKAPDVTFDLLGGGTVALHSLEGRKVLLHFWASWCRPCRVEFSGLLERIERDKGNTVLLAVSGDIQAQDATRFIAPYKSQFKKIFDNGNVIIAHDPRHVLIEGVFQTFKYPETIVIAPDITMQEKIVGIYK